MLWSGIQSCRASSGLRWCTVSLHGCLRNLVQTHQSVFNGYRCSETLEATSQHVVALKNLRQGSLLSLDWWTCLGVIPNSEPICSHLCGRSNLALICHSMPFMITLWCSVSISALWSAMPHHSIPFLSILFNSRLFLIQYDSSIFNSSFFDILWYFYEVPKRIKFCSQKNTAVLVCCSFVWATWIWNRFGGRRALQIIA